MNSILFILSFILTGTLILPKALAHPLITVTHYTDKDGLLNPAPNPLLIDKTGHLWLGYNGGLQLFNGKTFTTFDNSSGLQKTDVFWLKEDTSGNVYTVTESGVYRYAGGSGAKAFIPLDTDLTYNAQLIDHTHYYTINTNGKLYYHHGIARTVIPVGNDSFVTMEGDRKGNVYLSAGTMIYRLYDGRIKDSTAFSHTYVSLWKNGADIYAHGYLDTNIYKIVSGKPARYASDPRFALAPLLSFHPIAIVNGTRWLMTESGKLLRLNTNSTDTILSLSNGSKLTDMLVTKQGLWASSQIGLYYFHTSSGCDTASTNYILASNGFGGRLALITPAAAIPARVAAAAAAYKAQGALNFIYKDKAGGYWVVGFQALKHYLPQGDTDGYAQVPDPLGGNQFTGIFEDSKAGLWILAENKVLRYEKGIYQSCKSAAATGLDNYAGRLSPGAAIDGRDNFYIGATNGLLAYRQGRLENISSEAGLPNSGITDLCAAPDGSIWVVNTAHTLYHLTNTGKNLRITDSVAATWTGYRPDPFATACDRQGNLWVNYTQQIVVFLKDEKGHFSSNHIVCFAGKDGLDDYGAYYRRILLLSDGHIMLNSARRLLFDPAVLPARRALPPPSSRIMGILLHGHPVDWEGKGYPVNADGLPQNASFNYDDNYFIFHYSGADLANGKYLFYRYKLLGADKEWQAATTDDRVSYNSLAPGSYQFVVQAANMNKQWGLPCKVSFTIRPPWYRTWWAYMLYLLVAGFSLYVLFTSRIRVLKRRAAVEKLVVEQQLKALRAQINPHFLQNTFDFLGQSLKQQLPAYTLKVIAQLSAYLRNVLYRTDQIVLRLEDELEFANEYLAINQLLFRGSFDYKIELGAEVDTIGVKVPSMILQPILENAIKHGVRHGAGNGAKPIIRLSTVEEPGSRHLRCSVTNTIVDDVAAATPDEGYKSIGLENTQARLALFYKNCIYQPSIKMGESANGTFTVTIMIPLD